ncbi:Hsp20 family protein [Paracrocinitomix mangrovi]|uniref:Hsp20/alpha crystallin family protein n=1 Tax=Paracrocinitomix mangrovi TaxID=2862509 RepID=UPI001C8E02F8|nr:Hsp20/alpha crystallin family protein [Paracrocinitomix mangrovi]UKN03237.1 Hsp20 family protein [Paracrocinitomix mangrovi]
MKKKFSRIWKNLKGKLSQFLNSNNSNSREPIAVPIAGIKEDQIICDPDEGILVIEAERRIYIEEADRFESWKMHNTYGFDRYLFLPNGVSVKRVKTKIEPDQVKIYW